ncbi:MAG: hypothetical protein IIU99_05480 [Treponema sp.]|nr:hypothetical protein [Treponema sp.]
MKNVLLTSPDFVRLNSNISDNVNSKVLATAIREVQEDELQEILGQLLFEKLQDLVENNTIDNQENAAYKNLLDKAQMFITYRVIAEIIVMLNMKIDNAGLIQTRDENMDYMGLDDTMTMKNYYDTKASHYAYLLQNYLMEHLSEIPELTECQAWKIRSTLYSAASPSVFLGGARGRGWFRFFPYRYQRGANWPSK